MRAINQKARAVMDQLTAGLNKVGDHKKIANSTSFMAVHIELTEMLERGAPVFSVAHYYEQNGDLMRDPEMCFVRGFDNNYYPVYFRQDGGIPFEQFSARIENRSITGFNQSVQSEHAVFAGMWMKNINEQQRLEAV